MIQAIMNRLKKRQDEMTSEDKRIAAKIATSWPFGNISPMYGSIEGLATTRRCISLYSQFLSILDLETEDGKDHYFIKLLEKPHPAYRKSEFMEALCWETLLNGQFVCRLMYDRNNGKIKTILPYRYNTAKAYVKSGDYSDPKSTMDFYYRSNYDGEVWWPDEALHIKDNLQTRGDIINAYPRSYFYKSLFDSGVAVQNATLGLGQTGGRGAVVMEGLDFEDTERAQEVRKMFKEQVQSGLSETTKGVIGLPPGYKPHRLLGEQSHSLMTWLAERNDLELAKIWDVPFEILQVGKIGAQSLKEVWRQWIRINLRAFTGKVAQAFTDAVNDGTKFVFRVGKLRFSDQREAANYYSSLIDSGVLKPDDVAEALEEKI